MMFWNANGVLNDQNLFPEFFVEPCINTALLKETHLQPTKKWSTPACAIYRTERRRQIVLGKAKK
jgi:hypothetical protein